MVTVAVAATAEKVEMAHKEKMADCLEVNVAVAVAVVAVKGVMEVIMVRV